MVFGNYAHLQEAAPSDTVEGFDANGNTALQEASVFLAGRLAENVGTFTQLTYSGRRQGVRARPARPALGALVDNQRPGVDGRRVAEQQPDIDRPVQHAGTVALSVRLVDFGAGYGVSPLMEAWPAA